MKSLVDDLKSVSLKKHVVTSIEYDCKSEEKENEVFDTVRDLSLIHI